MIKTYRQLVISLIVLFTFSAATAQTRQTGNQATTPIVTATASHHRVRYAALGEVHQTRLQVFSLAGEQVYDSAFRPGNLIDWNLENQRGESLAEGAYLYLITVKEFSERLTQKYGAAVLEQEQVYLEQVDRNDLPQLQATALEANRLAETLSAVDRIGASGVNRATATDSTSATSGGVERAPGTKDASALDPIGVDVAGTGTQNRVAKWIDNAGTLGDSVMFDNGTGVGVGTTDLSDVLVAGNDKFKVVDGAMTFSLRDFSSGQGYFAVGSSTNGIKGFIGHTNSDDGFTLGTFSNHKLTIRTNSINRLTINTLGNVGIGTTSPSARLDVAGAINTSNQYNIGGNRVLSVGPINNTFVGVFTATNNTDGFNNSFFGTSAGASNTGGNSNSFFGVGAGASITTGNSNSFFGHLAGFGNMTDSYNTFIGSLSGGATGVTNATALGRQAAVTQSNSLVLGSIATVNGATDSTSVGIGTTAPKARLEIQGGNLLMGSPGQGIVLKSPDGSVCRLLTIDNAGNLVSSVITCP